MVASTELSFLHACGSQLRARLSQVQATTEDPNDLRRIARSTLLDLLGARQELATPILGILEQLIPPKACGGTEATLAAIHQQLQLTYNGQTTQQALSFVYGFVGLSAAAAMNRVQGATLPPVHIAPTTSADVAAQDQSSSVSAPGLAVVNQSLSLLIALGSIGVISFLAIRNSSVPAASPASRPLTSPPSSTATTPARPETAPSPPVVAPAANGASLYDAGVAVGGQRVLLDPASLVPAAEPGLIHFRYRLGNQSVDAVADCNRQSWTTYPEAVSHRPQSAATARMLERVCDGAISAAPANTTAGAGIVFDPPSNIRATPNGAILCAVTRRGTIPIQGREGDWYRTDFCGTPGYIHSGQLRF